MKHKIKDFVENHDPHNLHRIKSWEIEETDYLWICARAGKTFFVKYLLGTERYDIHDRDDYAIRWACKYNHIEIVKILLNVGANIHAHRDEGIEYAKQHTDKKLYNILMKHIKKLKTK
jgi:ankyrin repeat protein